MKHCFEMNWRIDHVTTPKSNEYPYMIELFSRNPDFAITDDDTRIVPLPLDEEISSLSAILLNEAYYELLKSGRQVIDGISVLNTVCLIPFKAKAWLDLKSRKDSGERIDSKNIRKHKNDVYRLAQLLGTERKALNDDIQKDMSIFLDELEREDVDLKAIGVLGVAKEQLIRQMRQCYGIE